MADSLVAYFHSAGYMRSRSVGPTVLVHTVSVAAPPASVVADWERDIHGQLGLDVGDVEPLSLARTRARWPQLKTCVQAASDWAVSHGLHAALCTADMALMACRAARYHHDGLQYGAHAFCNLFLSEDKGLDLHFAALDLRIPLARGTLVVFDTCQPHAVIRRGGKGFQASDFAPGSDCSQVFLTWELPVEDACVATPLGIRLDTDNATAQALDEEQVHRGGTRAQVCPQWGHWQAA